MQMWFSNQLITKLETWLPVQYTHNLERVNCGACPFRKLKFILYSIFKIYIIQYIWIESKYTWFFP